MSAPPTFDDLAATLGRARLAHERRPDDRAAEMRFHEAHAAYLAAALARAEHEARVAKNREAAAREALRRLEQGLAHRIAAVIRKSAPRRRARARDAGAPLLERVLA